ncbi:MAG TPA: hypothetical protein VN034_04090, partial [Sphingopyxis sp.]|nr:hypothetical protein [Sphingopyxis sp.]
QRLKAAGIAPGGLTDAEFARQIGLEEARRAAAGTTLTVDFGDDGKADDAAEGQEPPEGGTQEGYVA